MDDLKITNCQKADWDEIIRDFDEFWDTPITRGYHNAIFLNEFGDTAFVIRSHEGVVAAYLFGFFSQTDAAVAYIHLVATRRSFRRKGLMVRLYDHFADHARRHRRSVLKAVTSTDNRGSVAFHQAFGMTPQLVKDYAGVGHDRIVMKKQL
jgi:GNAT superfamily N-acetyltransferase